MKKIRLYSIATMLTILAIFTMVPNCANAQLRQIEKGIKLIKRETIDPIPASPLPHLIKVHNTGPANVYTTNPTYEKFRIALLLSDSSKNVKQQVRENHACKYFKLSEILENDSLKPCCGLRLLKEGYYACKNGREDIADKCFRKYVEKCSHNAKCAVYDINQYYNTLKRDINEKEYLAPYLPEIFDNMLVSLTKDIHNSITKQVPEEIEAYVYFMIEITVKKYNMNRVHLIMSLKKVKQTNDTIAYFQALTNAADAFTKAQYINKEKAAICQDYLTEAAIEYALNRKELHNLLLDFLDKDYSATHVQKNINRIFSLYIISLENNDERKKKYYDLGHMVDSEAFGALLGKHNKTTE